MRRGDFFLALFESDGPDFGSAVALGESTVELLTDKFTSNLLVLEVLTIDENHGMCVLKTLISSTHTMCEIIRPGPTY